MPLFIPSPDHGVWYLGPLPIRGYALSILTGIIIAILIARRRWKKADGRVEQFEKLALISVVIGIIGARLYWVIIEWPRYFGEGGTWYYIFYVWQGGLGIWGGIALGFLSAWFLCRRYNISFLKIADCVAPAFLIAQGIGRLGNWWNQELYGLPTTVPWALEIDPIHRVPGFEQYATFHPTFLYEMLWNFAGAAVLFWLGKKFLVGRGVVFATYVIIYAIGRFGIELLRIDPVEVIGGMRVNNWTTLLGAAIGVIFLVWVLIRGKKPSSTQESVLPDQPDDSVESEEEPILDDTPVTPNE